MLADRPPPVAVQEELKPEEEVKEKKLKQEDVDMLSTCRLVTGTEAGLGLQIWPDKKIHHF